MRTMMESVLLESELAVVSATTKLLDHQRSMVYARTTRDSLRCSHEKARYYGYQPSENGKLPSSLLTLMSFISPHSSTAPCTPNDGASGTQGHHLPNHQSQQTYDSIGFGARFGADVRQRTQAMPRFFTGRVSRMSRLYSPAFNR